MTIYPKDELKTELSKIVESLETMEAQFCTTFVVTEKDKAKRSIRDKLLESCYLLNRVLSEIDRL